MRQKGKSFFPSSASPPEPAPGRREEPIRGAARHPLPSGEREKERVCVAKIGGPHGIRGEVRLQSFTADPMALAGYGPLQSGDGSRSLEIEGLRPGKGFLVGQMKGINDRSAAEQLRNVELYVPRKRLPEPAADEFYHADLVGLAVVDRAGAKLGTVVALHNFGAGDLLEIQPVDGDAAAMLPFTQSVVPVVDIAGGRIVIDPPQGMFRS